MRPGVVIAQVMVILSAVPITLAGQKPPSPSSQAQLQQLVDRFLRQGETARLQLLNQVSVAELAPRLITSTARVVQLQRLVGSRPIYYITDNLDAAHTVGVHRVWSGGGLGLALSGAGVTVALWDGGGVLTSHQEFGGRLARRDATLPAIDHATHIAGTIAAAGIQADARGMAGGIQLDSYDWNDDTAEMATAASAGLVLSNHSFSTVAGWERDFFGDGHWAWHGDPTVSNDEDWVFGFYLPAAADWDDLAIAAPDYLMVTSAGNDRADAGPGPGQAEHWVHNGEDWVWTFAERNPDGDYDSLPGGASCAKNVLVVGAVADIPGGYQQAADAVMTTFSSWGPTDDGRIKPDLVANGTTLYSTSAQGVAVYDTLSGTSTAAAVVTGSLALLQEHYRASHGGAQPRSATMRALVVHSADEAGNAPGPDYSFGWGLLNTAAAAEVISLDALDSRNVQELVLSDGGEVSTIVTSDGLAPLKVTIAWTDPPGTVPATALDPTDPMLVNDLDLTLTSLVTQQWEYPWVLDYANPEQTANTGNNDRDNIEQVFVPLPMAGDYRIMIGHKGILASGSQQFSLIVTGAAFPPRPRVLVWEGDSAIADYSGRFIRDALSMGDSIDIDYRLELPADLSVYDAAFLSFGNYGGGSGKSPFSDEQAAVVQAYLEGRGRLYLEGGDALGAVGSDQGGNDTLWSLLGLDSVADGPDNTLNELIGQIGSLAEGITFDSYQGSFQYIDR
ncbi:MAG: S8 family serine peptidase, partial [Candidatus Neomarinimicrobiota bacterium]